MRSFFSLLIFLGVGISQFECAKVGVLFMHGWKGSENDPYSQYFKKYIENKTELHVKVIDAFNGIFASSLPLDIQVKNILPKVKELAKGYEHVIAVGHSQGGVIWRGMLENWTDHNVDTFVSLASPQHGIIVPPEHWITALEDYVENKIDEKIDMIVQLLKLFGHDIPDIVVELTKDSIAEAIELFVKYGVEKNLTLKKLVDFEQSSNFLIGMIKKAIIEDLLKLSPLNYYMDPVNYELYRNKIHFFPDVNNERPGTSETVKATRKANFVRLRKLVMIGGPDDGVVVPWESELFGYCDEGGFTYEHGRCKNTLNLTETRFYNEDLFGLKSLYDNGNVTLHVVPGVGHVDFLTEETVLESYVLPVIEEVKRLYYE